MVEPTGDPVLDAIHAHDARSDARMHEVKAAISELKSEEIKMSEPINMFTAPSNDNAALIGLLAGGGGGWNNRGYDGGSTAGAVGGGLGAGILGGILGGGLLGGRRGGLFGGGDEGVAGGIVTPALLASSLANVTETQNNTTVLQTLGDIKASIPLAEGQVQLALAGNQAAISNQIGQVQISSIQGFANVNQNLAAAQAGIIAVGESVKDTVQTTSAATNLAIANLATQGLQNTWALSQAVNADGEKTRALIIAQNDANLQRQLTVAENALLEQRAIGRSRDVEVNVTQTVNQQQVQLQAQAQQQQQLIILSQVASALNGLQNAVATNSNMIIGNTGATATGPQTANPVNVRT